MSWDVIYLPEALNDLRALDGSQRLLVRKALEKLKRNPLPETEGGYGKWLGNKGGTDLAGFLKVKLRGAGLRIVYQLRRVDDHVLIIVIGAREDSEVYDTARKRIGRSGL
jgi:mRNA interferase RelE/StbE